MSSELTTFLLSIAPITELRLALPWGITVGGLSYASAYFWSLAGNLTATILVIFLLDPVANFFRRWHFFDRILTRLFAHTRHKHSERFKHLGAFFLVLFVAIPLPGSGGYSAALIAYLFGVSRRHAIILIALGLALSGGVVLVITSGVLRLSGFF